MKFYDKEIYRRNENIKSAVVIILSFLLGFIAGCIAIDKERQANIQDKQNKINELYIEIDSLKETIHMYEVYGK